MGIYTVAVRRGWNGVFKFFFIVGKCEGSGDANLRPKKYHKWSGLGGMLEALTYIDKEMEEVYNLNTV